LLIFQFFFLHYLIAYLLFFLLLPFQLQELHVLAAMLERFHFQLVFICKLVYSFFVQLVSIGLPIYLFPYFLSMLLSDYLIMHYLSFVQTVTKLIKVFLVRVNSVLGFLLLFNTVLLVSLSLDNVSLLIILLQLMPECHQFLLCLNELLSQLLLLIHFIMLTHLSMLRPHVILHYFLSFLYL
jgi:hypothetical protein